MKPTSKKGEGVEAELSRPCSYALLSRLHTIVVLPVESPQDALHDLIHRALRSGDELKKGRALRLRLERM